MMKVTKEERRQTLDKVRKAINALDDVVGVKELGEYYNKERKQAFGVVLCALDEVLDLFPEDPADDPIEDEES